MKRILMLNYEFPPLGGGGGRVSYHLAKGFVDRGFGVDVITSGYRNLPHRERVDGIDIYRVPVLGRLERQTATFLSMVSYLVPGFLCAAGLCGRSRYVLINTHFVLPTGPLGVLLSKLFHVPNVLSIHGGDIFDPSKKSSPHRSACLKKVVRFLLEHSDRIVAQSSNTRENAVKYYHPEKPIEIIPLSYEPCKFDPATRKDLQLDEGATYLISVGRLVKRKGFDYLIRALPYLNDRVEVLIIGDGKEKNALLQLTEQLGLAGRVHFLGQIDEEKKFQYLSVADIYVLSSLHEGFGIVLQEAMQVGLPIVSTDEGGQCDIVKPENNGILVKTRDAAALAKAIRKLLDNKGLCRKMSANNLACLQRYGVGVIVDRYLGNFPSTAEEPAVRKKKQMKGIF